MHIAVTGAAGMIGRKLTDRLVADGYLPRLVFASSIAVYGAPLPDGHLHRQFRSDATTMRGERQLPPFLQRGSDDRPFLP